MSISSTPSLKKGIQAIPRLPPFHFNEGNVPERWFDDDSAKTATWEALSAITTAAERIFVRAGKELLPRIEDPAVAEETTRFMQQEGYHSAIHGRLNRHLATRGRPMEALDALLEEAGREVQRRARYDVFMASALAGEQILGELAHATLSDPAVMDGVAPAVRQMWLWHWYEEVEHQASLHDGWVHVFGDDEAARAVRVVGAIYTVALLGLVWPAGAWVMLDPVERRRTHWRPAWDQLLGRGGILRGALVNVRRFFRVGFHPFDNHDPVPTLERYRDELTDPAWERPLSRVRTGTRQQRRAEPIGPRDVFAALGFAGWLSRRVVRLVREH